MKMKKVHYLPSLNLKIPYQRMHVPPFALNIPLNIFKIAIINFHFVFKDYLNNLAISLPFKH